MLLPLADVRSDAHGIMHGWNQVCHTHSGSYSKLAAWLYKFRKRVTLTFDETGWLPYT